MLSLFFLKINFYDSAISIIIKLTRISYSFDEFVDAQGITNKEKSLNPKHLPCWEKKKITLIHSFLLFLPRLASGFEGSNRKQDQFFAKFQVCETLWEIVEM